MNADRAAVAARRFYNSHGGEVMRFAIVGVFNTCIDVSIFWTCTHVFVNAPVFDRIAATLAGSRLPIAAGAEDVLLVASNFAAWAVAFSISFVVNNLWTFRRHHTQFLRLPYYLRVAACNLVSWGVATTVLVQASPYMPLIAAKFLSIAVGFVLNFLIGKFMPLRF